VKPYRLIVTHDPDQTFGQGEMRYYQSLIEATNAFVKAREPFKTVIFDDGHEARELNNRGAAATRERLRQAGLPTSRTTNPMPRKYCLEPRWPALRRGPRSLP